MKKQSLGAVITLILATVLIYGCILYVGSAKATSDEYKHVDVYQETIESYAVENYDCIMHPEDAYVIAWEISEEFGSDLTEDEVREWLTNHPDKLQYLE